MSSEWAGGFGGGGVVRVGGWIVVGVADVCGCGWVVGVALAGADVVCGLRLVVVGCGWLRPPRL